MSEIPFPIRLLFHLVTSEAFGGHWHGLRKSWGLLSEPLEVLASSPWRVKLLVSLDLLSCQYPHHHGFHHFLFVFATSLVIKSVVLEGWPTFGMATTETQNKTKKTRTQLSHGPTYALLCSGAFHEHFSCSPIIYPWLSRHASRTHWVLVLGVSVHEKGGMMLLLHFSSSWLPLKPEGWSGAPKLWDLGQVKKESSLCSHFLLCETG